MVVATPLVEEKKAKIELEPFRKITVKQLIRAIKEGHKNAERFCFVLGAGASMESGIPDGQTQAYQWMEEIMSFPESDLSAVRENAKVLKASKKIYYNFEDIQNAWEEAKKQKEQKNQKKGKLDSKYYFDVYILRFFPNTRHGYFALEKAMEGKQPSLGYHPLALMLADDEHESNLVVTTNFDTMVEDALSLYTERKPLVINHELLAEYAGDPNIKRPIVAKIHRGMFFDPLNQPEEMRGLKGKWKSVLSHIFNCYTPIVIGYAGGDHSLMDFLKDEDLVLRNGIYWCYYEPGWRQDAEEVEDILKIVIDKDGYLVATQGFDAVLWAIGKELYPSRIDPDQVEDYWIKQRENRMKRYVEQRNQVQEKEFPKGDPDKTGANSGGEAVIKSRGENIESGVSIELTGNNAWECNRRGDECCERAEYWEAIQFYTAAIQLQPDVALFYRNRGDAHQGEGDRSKAIEDYSKAITLEPDDAFAYYYRGACYEEGDDNDRKKALVDYTKAIEIEPDFSLFYFARGLLNYELKNFKDAVADFSHSIELAPTYIDYERRACAYRAMGQSDLAEADEATAKRLEEAESI